MTFSRTTRTASATAAAIFVSCLLVSQSARSSPSTMSAADEDERPLAELAQPLDPKVYGIGEVVPDLAFTDLDGRSGRLSDYADRDALVIVIRDVGCPVSKKYGLRTAEIEKSYAPKNVAFLYVNTNHGDELEDCRAEVAEYGFAGHYAREHDGRFKWHFKVRTTADVFVLDADRKLRYRGAIDDQMGRGVTKPEPTREYLKEALESVLKGERVADSAMTAPGCALDLPSEPVPETAPSGPAITWHGRVEWIVQEKCQRCHRQGGAAPFPLETLDDFAGNEARVRQAVVERTMPKWPASKASAPFKNDMSLSDQDRLDLLKWLQAGCPPGEPKDAPPPRTWPTGWTIEPDLIVEIPRPVDIPATGIVDYLNVATPSGLDRDVWVQAVQILCDNPQICHHILVLAEYPESRANEFIDSYLPGREATVYPEGMAVKIEKGAVFRFNLHYTPNGKPVTERTKVGIQFAKTPPKVRVSGKIVKTKNLLIPPHKKDYVATVEKDINFDAHLRRVVPHMHMRGVSEKIELFFPDGTSRLVIDLDRWDPYWQFAYELADPIFMPKGTVLRSTCTYDNSKDNPFNPAPHKPVRQGPQITDEMGGAFIEWIRPVNSEHEPRDEMDPEDR